MVEVAVSKLFLNTISFPKRLINFDYFNFCDLSSLADRSFPFCTEQVTVLVDVDLTEGMFFRLRLLPRMFLLISQARNTKFAG